jgi:hypothetical protein
MDVNMMNRDYVKSEINYRRDRIGGDIAGRRRRSIIRRATAGESTFGTVR